MELDKFDRQILNLVQQDAAMSALEMARTVPLSASAIQRRLRRLRDDGIIERSVAVVDPARLGSPVTCAVSVQLASERPELVARFRRWLKESPHVQQVYYVTGDTDYLLFVTAANTSAFDALMAQMVEDHPNVQRFTTNVVLNALKRGLAIPV